MIQYVKTAKDLDTILRDVQQICPKVTSVVILNGLLCFQCDINLEQDEVDRLIQYDPTTLAMPPKPLPEPVIKPVPIQPPPENQE